MKASERFRTNLATAIEAEGLTHAAVAQAAGLKRPYITRVLSGATDPGMDQCERLAKAVGFPLSALLDAPEIFSESVLTAR